MVTRNLLDIYAQAEGCGHAYYATQNTKCTKEGKVNQKQQLSNLSYA